MKFRDTSKFILFVMWANTNRATANSITIGTAAADDTGQLPFTDTNAPGYKPRSHHFLWP
jgi:hypothetical protein